MEAPGMPGTPPLGPAALSPVLDRTHLARRAVSLLVLAVAAAVASLVASPADSRAAASCPNAADVLGAAPAAAVEVAVTCLVNAERAARGLGGVQPTGALELSAQRHANDMVARRYFAHVSPTGGTVDKRARRAGYLSAPCWALGEDLGSAPAAVASAEAVVAAWMESPGHRAVILDPSFRDAGIGIVNRRSASEGAGATFVLEMGAMVACEDAGPRGSARATPRARIRVS
jgi:uncharacterized protein YkwD